jgi:hypothetical protein
LPLVLPQMYLGARNRLPATGSEQLSSYTDNSDSDPARSVYYTVFLVFAADTAPSHQLFVDVFD